MRVILDGEVQLGGGSGGGASVPTGLSVGAKTVVVAGTAEALSASSIPCQKVVITAEDDNTGKIYWGDASVSSLVGDYLFPAQKVTVEIDNVQKIFIDADTAGDGVKFTALT